MDDAQLLRLFASTCDEQAFAMLVDRHGPMVLGICRRVLRNSADADDAFQATFLLLAIKAGKIRQPQLLGSWLFGVATRTAVAARRAHSRRLLQEMRLMRILRPKSASAADGADVRLTLDEEIDRLPDKYRRVIVACYLQGMSKRQAADHLKWPEGTVATRLSYALRTLRKRLADQKLASPEGLATALAPVTIPAALASSTIKLGLLGAAGKLAGAAAVSAQAICAAKAASNAMTLAKIKIAAALLMVSVLAVTGTALVVQPRVQSQPVIQTPQALKLPPQVEQALRRNAELVDPIDVSWNQRNRPDIPLEKALSFLKAGPFIFVASTREIILQHGKVYARVLTPDNASKNEVSFDGRILYLGNMGGKQVPTLSKRLNSEIVKKERPNGTGRGDTWISTSYFDQIGLQMPATAAELQTGRPESTILWLLAHGAILESIDTVSIDATSLARLSLSGDNPLRKWADATDRAQAERYALGMSPRGRQNFIELWEKQKKLPLRRDYVFFLDPQMAYAVVRSQERYGPQLLFETINSDFEPMPGRALWLPRKSSTQHFASPDNPGAYSDASIYTQIIERTAIRSAAAPDEQFVLNPTAPGTQVFDQTLPGKPRSDVVPRPGGEATAAAARPSPPATRPASPRQTFQPLAYMPEAAPSVDHGATLLWSIVLIMAAGGAAVVWRIRRALH